MIITYSGPDGRRVLVADANPGIFGLPTPRCGRWTKPGAPPGTRPPPG